MYARQTIALEENMPDKPHVRFKRDDRYNECVAIRISPAQRAFLESLAIERSVSISTLIRMLIDEAMIRAKEQGTLPS